MAEQWTNNYEPLANMVCGAITKLAYRPVSEVVRVGQHDPTVQLLQLLRQEAFQCALGACNMCSIITYMTTTCATL